MKIKLKLFDVIRYTEFSDAIYFKVQAFKRYQFILHVLLIQILIRLNVPLI